MRRVTFCFVTSALGLGCLQAFAQTNVVDAAADDRRRAYYSAGVELVEKTSLREIDASDDDLRWILRGAIDQKFGRVERPSLATEESVERLLRELKAQRANRAREVNKGRLHAMASLAGAKQLPSGVVVVPLRQGSGRRITRSDRVSVHYVTRLVDETVIDDSKSRQQPHSGLLESMLPCWRDGIVGYPDGSTLRLGCPPAMAYGERGQPPRIPPGAMLDFELVVRLAPTEAR